MVIEILSYFFFSIYTVSLACITLYCLSQFHLLLKYLRQKKKNIHPRTSYLVDAENLPLVTIQLPVFNERYVIGRLIDNIVKLEYPPEKLQIQLLDDSTDETVEICKAKVQEYVAQGIPLEHIHRPDRHGFKAGALSEGLSSATGEFIAVFDADFLPPPDFLLTVLPHFNAPDVGVVQTRWGHINQDYSMITLMQAFQLNVHFSVEQTGRQAAKYFLQFNGTAGIWRRAAIEDAGGWKADTLTEDLDLSYRAQLKGWKIKYCQQLVSPAELPIELPGLKSQQFRWMKGGAENAKKQIPAILKSSLSHAVKVNALIHLLSSSVFVFILLLAVSSVPLALFSHIHVFHYPWLWLFSLGLPWVGFFYFIANSDTLWQGKSLGRRIVSFSMLFPAFLTMSMGLSLHNSVAVLEGYSGRKSSFIRTPKLNIRHRKDASARAPYRTGGFTFFLMMEGMLALYFLFGFLYALWQGNHAFIVFLLLLAVGFGSIFLYTLIHSFRR